VPQINSHQGKNGSFLGIKYVVRFTLNTHQKFNRRMAVKYFLCFYKNKLKLYRFKEGENS